MTPFTVEEQALLGDSLGPLVAALQTIEDALGEGSAPLEAAKAAALAAALAAVPKLPAAPPSSGRAGILGLLDEQEHREAAAEGRAPSVAALPAPGPSFLATLAAAPPPAPVVEAVPAPSNGKKNLPVLIFEVGQEIAAVAHAVARLPKATAPSKKEKQIIADLIAEAVSLLGELSQAPISINERGWLQVQAQGLLKHVKTASQRGVKILLV